MTSRHKSDFGIFDEIRPPERGLADECVHCGFCLPACPTYELWGQEVDSPRGRIHLIKLGLAGEIEMDNAFRQHFDACLGCMACMTACPSGVQYEPLLQATRAQIERKSERPRAERAFRRLLLTVFPNRRLLRGAALGAWLYQRLNLRRLLEVTGVLRRLPARLRVLDELMPEVTLHNVVSNMPEVWPSRGPKRARVALLAGCVQSVFFRQVNISTARVLAREGCEVLVPRQTPCCGALSEHAGLDDLARAQARGMIELFEPLAVDRIIVNSAGCGAMLRHYGRLLRDDRHWSQRAAAFSDRVRDVMEFLDELGATSERRPLRATVAYHDACHLAHAQNIRAAPRRLLATIPELSIVEIPDGEMCCGSAGIYNLTQAEPADALGRRKAAHILSVNPDYVAAANPGCLLQLRRYLRPEGVSLVHPIELLDLAT